MNTNFDNLDYLKNGNPKQKRVYEVLTKNRVMDILSSFDPLLVGTIPICIDIEDSDLDIICCYQNKNEFIKLIKDSFSDAQHFKVKEAIHQQEQAVVANFRIDDFDVEIFGQQIPTREQNAYRHMLIEHQLLCERGEDFRQRIVELKQKGYKTEPAFALMLGLKGDPYSELLNYYTKY